MDTQFVSAYTYYFLIVNKPANNAFKQLSKYLVLMDKSDKLILLMFFSYGRPHEKQLQLFLRSLVEIVIATLALSVACKGFVSPEVY